MGHFLDNIKYITKRLRIVLPENTREFVDIFCENLMWKDKKLVWKWKKPYHFWIKDANGSDVQAHEDSNLKWRFWRSQ